MDLDINGETESITFEQILLNIVKCSSEFNRYSGESSVADMLASSKAVMKLAWVIESNLRNCRNVGREVQVSKGTETLKRTGL